MDQYKLMKALFDSGEEEFSLEEIANLSGKKGTDLEKHVEILCKKRYLKKTDDTYHFTENARIEFANDFSKRVFIMLILASFFITAILYVIARSLS
ncbi:hypothetical protein ERUR111494_02385 [Erysipelothrix urinaevulpis]|uniref:hypothetical protein n=1 Tax=Erysipelothrix urinaevulpis TaxID=2683717 RepID=UPI001359B6CE|nr:hypothetical protein [Erysipelothrix urinaevulpis]